MDVCGFPICRCLYGSPVIDFTTARTANSDSAYWNGAPVLFLLALDWHGMIG